MVLSAFGCMGIVLLAIIGVTSARDQLVQEVDTPPSLTMSKQLCQHTTGYAMSCLTRCLLLVLCGLAVSAVPDPPQLPRALSAALCSVSSYYNISFVAATTAAFRHNDLFCGSQTNFALQAEALSAAELPDAFDDDRNDLKVPQSETEIQLGTRERHFGQIEIAGYHGCPYFVTAAKIAQTLYSKGLVDSVTLKRGVVLLSTAQCPSTLFCATAERAFCPLLRYS